MGNLFCIKGQGFVLKVLKNQYRNKRVPHCYIFYGQKGIGKQTTAAAFSKLLNCQSPLEETDACGVCRSCRMIESGNHPEIINFNLQWQAQSLGEKEKKRSVEYKIKAIRELIRRLNLKFDSSSTRVVIIDEAERLNEDASGALLKTLEEPPDRTVFMLVVENLQKILPTIISRSQILYFRPPDKETFKMIAGAGNEDVRDEDFYACNASPGLFEKSLQDEADIGDEIIENYLQKEGRFAEVAEWIETAGNDSEVFGELLDRLIRSLRENRILSTDQMKAVGAVLSAKKAQEHFVNNQLISLDLYLKMKE